MKGGGEWLRCARVWLQWHKPNGSTIIWGSNEEVRITAKEIEELALEVALGAVQDIRNGRIAL